MLLGLFFDLPLFDQGERVDIHQKLKWHDEVERSLWNVTGPVQIFISDTDPGRFLMAFVYLCEKGHLPIPVSPEMPLNQVKNLVASMPELALIWRDGVLLTECPQDIPTLPYTSAYACLTSGTTGLPKLCYLSIEGALKNAKAHGDSLGLSSKNHLLQSLPVFHSFGVVCYLFTALVFQLELDLHKIFLGLRGLLKKNFSNMVLHISPSQLRFMLKEGLQLMKKGEDLKGLSQRLEVMSIGGGLVDAHELTELRALLPETRIYVTYGLTEAGPRVSTGSLESLSGQGSIGFPFEGVKVVVLGAEGLVRPHGQGHLCLNSPSLKLNCLNDDVITTQNGTFLKTRDWVTLTELGEIIFHSRGEDLIKVGGVSVYPQDIERAVRNHEAIEDCIVVKVKDGLYEEVPYLIAQTNLTPAEVSAYLQVVLAPYQWPKEIFTVQEFPRHSLSKINRGALFKQIGIESRM